ncbi:hypothetical protein B0J17DRAFT_458238 [Rhizoctonia solani]|nr:hypothetical protein B0J17DRAFT_458238 [Rhizoctonia solani]
MAHTQSSTNTECIGAFLRIIQRLSLELRFGPPGHWHINGRQGSPAAIDLINLRLCWCVALMLGNMPEVGEYVSIGVETIKRLADDDMPLKYRHRHSTSAGLYHEFADSTGQISCLETLCRTFRHESLCLVLDSLYQDHATKDMDSVRLIICENSSRLVEKLERLLRGEDPDSSSESNPEDDMYQDYMDQYQDMEDEQYDQEEDFPDFSDEDEESEKMRTRKNMRIPTNTITIARKVKTKMKMTD